MMFPGWGIGGWMMAAASIVALLLVGLAVITVVALLRLNRGARPQRLAAVGKRAAESAICRRRNR
jgi:hypothetical protein